MKKAILASMFLVVSCASKPLPQAEPAPHKPEWEQVLDLNEGQTVSLNDAGFKLGFVIPVEDSRCPDEPGIVCEQAGRFVGKFLFDSLSPGYGQTFVFLLSTEQHCAVPECGPIVFTGREQSRGGSVYYAVVIEDVLPHRSENGEILEPYRVRLRISN